MRPSPVRNRTQTQPSIEKNAEAFRELCKDVRSLVTEVNSSLKELEEAMLALQQHITGQKSFGPDGNKTDIPK